MRQYRLVLSTGATAWLETEKTTSTLLAEFKHGIWFTSRSGSIINPLHIVSFAPQDQDNE